MHELFNKMEEYARSELDHLRRKSDMEASKTPKTNASTRETKAGHSRDRPKHVKKAKAFECTSKQINQIDSGPVEVAQGSSEAQGGGTRGG